MVKYISKRRKNKKSKRRIRNKKRKPLKNIIEEGRKNKDIIKVVILTKKKKHGRQIRVVH